MKRTELKRLVHAHDSVWTKWWPALIDLPKADARRVVGGSHGSVMATTVHMVSTEIYWQHRLERVAAPRGPTRLRGLTPLHAEWEALQARRRRWLRDADADRRVTFLADSGARVSVAAWECLVHVVSHAHFQRGQLVSQFRALGIVPPSRHLIGPFFSEF